MKKLFAFLLLAVLALSARAQSLPSLYTPLDTRSMALGGAGAALDAGAMASSTNFAATALDNRNLCIGFVYGQWAPVPEPDHLGGIGGWYRDGRVSFGLAATGAFHPAIEMTDISGRPLGNNYSPVDITLAASGAFLVVPGLGLSATARLISSSLEENASGTAFSFDLDASLAFGGFQGDVGVANLGSPIRYSQDGNGDALPSLARAALAWNGRFLSITAQADYLFRYSLSAGAGLECRPLEWLSLRAGYHYGAVDWGIPSYAAAGLGLHFLGLSLDFAAAFASAELGGSFNAGLSYSF